MKWFILGFMLLISWVGGRWTVKKHGKNLKKLKQLERWNLIAMIVVMAGSYLLVKFTDQGFVQDYYSLMIVLFTSRLSLAVHRLFSDQVEEDYPESEKDSRLYGSIILILGLSLMLIWLIVGYISAGSLGTPTVAG